jgi:hypothetical protein
MFKLWEVVENKVWWWGGFVHYGRAVRGKK